MRSPEKRAAWIAANRERINAQQRARRAEQSADKKAENNKKAAQRAKQRRAKNKGAAYKPHDTHGKTGINAQSLTEYNRLYKRLQREKQKGLKDPNKAVLKNLLKALEAVK